MKIIYLLILLLITACNNNVNEEFIDETDFKETKSLIKSDNIIRDILYVDDFIVTDKSLIIKNDFDSLIFKAYDLNNLSHIKSWGFKGKASNEYLMPRLIKISDNKFSIFDKTSSKFELFDVSMMDICDKLDIDIYDMPMSICYIGNNTFIYDRIQSDNLSLFRWTIGKPPILINDFNNYSQKYKNSNIYNGFIAADSTSDRIIYAFQYIDGFDILDSNGDVIKKIRRKDHTDPVLKDNSIDYMNATTYCFGLRSNKNGFYIYRVGYSGAELKQDMNRITYIEEFDWNGNPIRRYEIPFFISNFEYTSDNRFILQDNMSEEEPLKIFDIIEK